MKLCVLEPPNVGCLKPVLPVAKPRLPVGTTFLCVARCTLCNLCTVVVVDYTLPMYLLFLGFADVADAVLYHCAVCVDVS